MPRDYTKLNGYVAQDNQNFNFIGVKEFNEKTTKTVPAKDMIEIVFENGLKQRLIINPETEEFYGFSDIFLADLLESFGKAKQGLGDVLNELAGGSKIKAWVKGCKEPYVKDDGSIGYGMKVFKMLPEEPNKEQIHRYQELAEQKTKELLEGLVPPENKKSNPSMDMSADAKTAIVDDDDDDDLPF